MKTYPCHIILTGASPGYRARLKNILKMTAFQNEWPSPLIDETTDLLAFEQEANKNTDIVMVDASIVAKHRKHLAHAWKKLKRACTFVLLFSDNEKGELEKVLFEMGRQNSLPLDVYILKDTYPDELIGRVLKRLVEQKNIEKNLAVV